MRRSDLFFRIYVTFNSVLLVLSFVPWFSGTAEAPGAADRLFGAVTLGGFRLDLVWLVIAFFITGFWTARNLVAAREGRHRLSNILIGAAWCAGFLFYVWHILAGGLLYMG